MSNSTAKKSTTTCSPHHKKNLTVIEFTSIFHNVNEKTKYGQSVESPPYYSNGSIWQLKLYSNGKSARNAGFVSIYITSSIALLNAKCQIQFTFLNQSDHNSFRATVNSECIERETQIGIAKMITTSELFDDGYCLWNNGTVKINVKLQIWSSELQIRQHLSSEKRRREDFSAWTSSLTNDEASVDVTSVMTSPLTDNAANNCVTQYKYCNADADRQSPRTVPVAVTKLNLTTLTIDTGRITPRITALPASAFSAVTSSSTAAPPAGGLMLGRDTFPATPVTSANCVSSGSLYSLTQCSSGVFFTDTSSSDSTTKNRGPEQFEDPQSSCDIRTRLILEDELLAPKGDNMSVLTPRSSRSITLTKVSLLSVSAQCAPSTDSASRTTHNADMLHNTARQCTVYWKVLCGALMVSVLILLLIALVAHKTMCGTNSVCLLSDRNHQQCLSFAYCVYFM